MSMFTETETEAEPVPPLEHVGVHTGLGVGVAPVAQVGLLVGLKEGVGPCADVDGFGVGLEDGTAEGAVEGKILNGDVHETTVSASNES